MQTEIFLAGFGGQGIMFAGQMLAYTAMDAGREVTWIPSYGPEMRGGTANCTVVIADEEIGSPLAQFPPAVVVMNLPSLDKYEGLVKPGGVLIYNSSLVERAVYRSDIRVIPTPANAISMEETATILQEGQGDAQKVAAGGWPRVQQPGGRGDSVGVCPPAARIF